MQPVINYLLRFLLGEGNEAFASAVVLLILTFIINLISDLIERHIAKKKG